MTGNIYALQAAPAGGLVNALASQGNATDEPLSFALSFAVIFLVLLLDCMLRKLGG